MIYVGTCGYAYKDWVGPFYPPRIRANEMLPYYARQFSAVEIDSSYYGIPKPETIASMNARSPERFRFSFKAPQTVTHAPVTSMRVHPDGTALRAVLEPLRASGKLACILAQFLNGFKPEAHNREYLRRVVEVFEGVPVVVEFRRRDWQRPETLALLREVNAGFVNVDLPRLEGLPVSSSDTTGSIGYVRLHGRNAAQWWTGDNVTRYEYSYAEDELAPWSDRVAEIEAHVEATYVFFNNHARGSAARNAEAFEALLEERFGDRAREIVARGSGGNPRADLLPGMPPYEEGV
ncbi:MAG: DUF72 domain-containing protein [Candidatus Baltobacteraceae bacterium]